MVILGLIAKSIDSSANVQKLKKKVDALETSSRLEILQLQLADCQRALAEANAAKDFNKAEQKAHQAKDIQTEIKKLQKKAPNLPTALVAEFEPMSKKQQMKSLV